MVLYIGSQQVRFGQSWSKKYRCDGDLRECQFWDANLEYQIPMSGMPISRHL